MKRQTKCMWCRGKSALGIHEICWKEFKGFMLSDRQSVERADSRSNALDEYMPTGQNYQDQQGRIVVQGRVMPITYPECE